jgi:hypothetical protein
MVLNLGLGQNKFLKLHPNSLNMISLYNDLLNIWRDCIEDVDKMPQLIQDKYSHTLTAIENSLSNIDIGGDTTTISNIFP